MDNVLLGVYFGVVNVVLVVVMVMDGMTMIGWMLGRLVPYEDCARTKD